MLKEKNKTKREMSKKKEYDEILDIERDERCRKSKIKTKRNERCQKRHDRNFQRTPANKPKMKFI